MKTKQAPKEKKICLMCDKPATVQYNSWAWYCGLCFELLEDAIDENKQGGSQSDD